MNQPFERHTLFAGTVVNAIGSGLDINASGHRLGEIVHMPELRDGAAIARDRYGATVDNSIEEPTLDRVVVARSIDIGRAEAGEWDAFASQPGFRFSFAGMAALRIGGAVFVQRPDVGAGIDAC